MRHKRPGVLACLALLLLLGPGIPRAQLPPPFEWSMTPSTCVPDDESVRRGLWRLSTNALTLPLTAVSRARSGAHLPLLVRCPITGQGQWLWRELEIVYRDPDGHGLQAGVVVVLKAQRFLAPSPWPVVEDLVRFESNRHGPDADRTVLGQRGIAQSSVDFATRTYWIELSLQRETLAVPPPRLYSLRLRYVPGPPAE